MGFLTKFLQTTFSLAFGLLIGAAVANLLANLFITAVPNYFSGQTSQLLSYISGVTLISFLLTNNPFFSAIVNAVAALVAIVGDLVLSNLFSLTKIYAQIVLILAYVTYIYSNAIFFFAHWIPLLVQGSIIAPVAMAFDYILIMIFLVAEILYLLIASCHISL